jgi:hypothetical protein
MIRTDSSTIFLTDLKFPAGQKGHGPKNDLLIEIDAYPVSKRGVNFPSQKRKNWGPLSYRPTNYCSSSSSSSIHQNSHQFTSSSSTIKVNCSSQLTSSTSSSVVMIAPGSSYGHSSLHINNDNNQQQQQ